MIPCIIFDLDGTLSDHQWRLPMIGPRIKGPNFQKRFEKYHANSHKDMPKFEILQELDYHFKIEEMQIILCTGRPEKFRKKTQAWLESWIIPFNFLMMRKDTDIRYGWEVKKDMINDLIEIDYLPTMLYDDDPLIIKMAKKLKIKTVHVKEQ